MENLEQKDLLLGIAEDRGEVIYKDNKAMAKLSWLRSWSKNPREAGKKDLTKLKAQMEELGVYKPLIICIEGDNATILGGNQRFKILTELQKEHKAKGSDRYDYVWVSIVNAKTDIDKVKYALSDNFSAGSYSRDKLKEILKVEQGNLFSDYQIEFQDKQEIEDFLDSVEKTENELKLESVSKQLKDIGITEDIIEDIKSMSNCQKIEENYNPQKIIGTGAIEFKDRKIFVLKLVFGDENELLYDELMKEFKVGAEIFREANGNLYQRLINFYGRGTGDVLVKTLHLLANLPTKKIEELKVEVEKKIEQEKEETKKYIEENEDTFSGGMLI